MRRNDLLNLGFYLMNGGKLEKGMDVHLELKSNEFIEASIIDYKEVQTVYSNLTLCRIGDNTATVVEKVSGKVQVKYPFSMIYVNKTQNC